MARGIRISDTGQSLDCSVCWEFFQRCLLYGLGSQTLALKTSLRSSARGLIKISSLPERWSTSDVPASVDDGIEGGEFAPAEPQQDEFVIRRTSIMAYRVPIAGKGNKLQEKNLKFMGRKKWNTAGS